MVKSRKIIEQLNQRYFELLIDAFGFTFEETVQQVLTEIISMTNISCLSIFVQKNGKIPMDSLLKNIIQKPVHLIKKSVQVK